MDENFEKRFPSSKDFIFWRLGFMTKGTIEYIVQFSTMMISLVIIKSHCKLDAFCACGNRINHRTFLMNRKTFLMKRKTFQNF